MSATHRCTLTGIEGQLYARTKWSKKLFDCIHISTKNPLSKLYFRSTSRILLERKRQWQSVFWYIIHPFSMFRLYWDCVMVVVFLLDLVVIPTNALFILKNPKCNVTVLWVVMSVADTVCVMDMVITCFSGYTDPQTKTIEISQRMILRKYVMHGAFFLDAATSVSVHFLCPFLDPDILLFLCMLKVFRARYLFKLLQRLSKGVLLNILFYRLAVFTFLSILLMHWIACIFILMPLHSRHQHFNTSWVAKEKVNVNSLGNLYKHGAYITYGSFLCIRHTAYELERTEEITVEIMCHVFGYIGCAILFVLVLQLVLSCNAPSTKYESIRNQLKQYMSHRQLPLPLQKRLELYYGHKFKDTYFNEAKIQSLLSDQLQNEINLYRYATLIENVKMLHSLSNLAVQEVVASLKCEIYLPNDVIIKAGSYGDHMYFISYGTVAISTPTGREVCHLHDGAYFGEVALLQKDTRRIANVVAIEICEVYKLDQNVFKECIATEPNTYKHIEKIAQDRTNRTNFLEELHKKHILERSMAKQLDI